MVATVAVDPRPNACFSRSTRSDCDCISFDPRANGWARKPKHSAARSKPCHARWMRSIPRRAFGPGCFALEPTPKRWEEAW